MSCKPKGTPCSSSKKTAAKQKSKKKKYISGISFEFKGRPENRDLPFCILSKNKRSLT